MDKIIKGKNAKNHSMASEYKKLIEAIIEKYGSVSNQDLAVTVANKVEGLEVDEEGKIKSGASNKSLKRLVDSIEDAVGPVALRFVRDSIDEGEVSEEVMEELPEKYKRN